MIQANELRIGNLIYSKEHNIIGKVTMLGLDSLDLDIRLACSLDLEDYEPIPLTEEWLLRFGFIDNEYTMELDGLILGWGSRIVSTKQRNSWSCQDYPHIEYVHQLQNLYFALTNKELTLKDN